MSDSNNPLILNKSTVDLDIVNNVSNNSFSNSNNDELMEKLLDGSPRITREKIGIFLQLEKNGINKEDINIKENQKLSVFIFKDINFLRDNKDAVKRMMKYGLIFDETSRVDEKTKQPKKLRTYLDEPNTQQNNQLSHATINLNINNNTEVTISNTDQTNNFTNNNFETDIKKNDQQEEQQDNFSVWIDGIKKSVHKEPKDNFYEKQNNVNNQNNLHNKIELSWEEFFPGDFVDLNSLSMNGIDPNNAYDKNNVSFKEFHKKFEDKHDNKTDVNHKFGMELDVISDRTYNQNFFNDNPNTYIVNNQNGSSDPNKNNNSNNNPDCPRITPEKDKKDDGNKEDNSKTFNNDQDLNPENYGLIIPKGSITNGEKGDTKKEHNKNDFVQPQNFDGEINKKKPVNPVNNQNVHDNKNPLNMLLKMAQHNPKNVMPFLFTMCLAIYLCKDKMREWWYKFKENFSEESLI